ncbi:MAG: hypothetical protein AAFP90_05385 [Planctomycetota bacterium]
MSDHDLSGQTARIRMRLPRLQAPRRMDGYRETRVGIILPVVLQ